MQIAYKRMITLWYRCDFIFNRTKLAKECYHACQRILAFSSSVVKDKRLALQDRAKLINENSELLLPKKRNNFLEHLIELIDDQGAHFTDEELREEVDTFMIAGSDTTATADSFVFLMLGMYPDVQENVYKEVIDVLGHDRPVECKDLSKFVYMERVIKETMRIFPPGPFLLRSVTKDIKLENCTLPAGSGVLLGIIALHRCPEVWPEPMKFDPDRFLPEAKRHSYSWLPFNGGLRSCIGPRYAMMSMKMLISMVIRRYRLATPYKTPLDIKLRNDIILKPQYGFNISLELRT